MKGSHPAALLCVHRGFQAGCERTAIRRRFTNASAWQMCGSRAGIARGLGRCCTADWDCGGEGAGHSVQGGSRHGSSIDLSCSWAALRTSRHAFLAVGAAGHRSSGVPRSRRHRVHRPPLSQRPDRHDHGVRARSCRRSRETCPGRGARPVGLVLGPGGRSAHVEPLPGTVKGAI
jgi:hypothetical protein